LAGDLKPRLKSEAHKASNDIGKVKVLTGESFEDKVIKGGRDALVMFHAPW